ncbi:succinate dehydrogenase [ubiquinone] cytochrome b small subunit A, mitochondrial-like [Sycon ciliatum]|uniref:succinate dehydrogenase [ubiquinone] cytochrome b small subunit A, mitochondrial-like n=1 Tax=Sycon ciliatum TaxID=27933 RepID=UPI0031F5F8DF
MATMNLFRLARPGCGGARLLLSQQTRSLTRFAPLRAVAATPQPTIPNSKNQLVQKRDYVSRAASNMWAGERVIAVAMLGLLPAGIAFPGYMVIDLSLGILLPLHAHFGLHQLVADYIHTNIGHRIFGVALPLLTGLTILSFFYFNFTDIGITAAFRKFWKAL